MKTIPTENINEVIKSIVVDNKGDVLMNARIIAQIDLIYLDFDACGDHKEGEYTAGDLRELARELNKIADISEKLFYV